MEYEIQITRQPPDVFAFLADPQTLAEWQSSTVAVRRRRAGGRSRSANASRRCTRSSAASFLDGRDGRPEGRVASDDRTVSVQIRPKVCHVWQQDAFRATVC
jgi:hypothetical protein